MKDYNGTPYVGLTCEVYTYDSTAPDMCGTYLGTAFNNLLIYLSVNIASSNWSNTAITNNFTFFDDKIKDPALFDFVTFQTSYNFSAYVPSLKYAVMPGTSYDSYTLKWYDPHLPGFYLTSWNRHYRLYSAGTLIDSTNGETAISYLFSCYAVIIGNNPYLYTFSGSYVDGVYSIQRQINIWRYSGNIRTSADNLGTATRRIINAFLNGLPDYKPEDMDPYAEGGYSGVGGGPGTGTFDLNSDVIGLPPLPTLSFASTGFTRIYNPSLSELNALANYLWTDQTFLDTVINHLKQLLENPMDAVISLSLLPCPIPNGTPEAVKVMYINTGVTMAPATTQFVDVDCGTYSLEEFYGSALDYNPYTKVHCYLPYIGQVTLDTDEVMGKTLNVVYRIDIVTGMCAAMILVNQNVLYQFSGHCSINMPINSADFSGYIGAAMTAGKMVAGVVAGASGNIPLAAELIGAPAPHSSTSETTEKTTERNPKTGRQITSGTSTRTTTRNTPGASFGEMSRKAAANTVGAVMGSKLTVEHAGGFTGNSGYLAVRRPYLIIERPRMCNPEEYGKYNGRPSMIYMNLGDCSGYTEVQSIQFDGISATNPELAELSELLKSGVLF